MNGKYLERFGKTWGTNAKHATAHGAGVRCPTTTISCMKISAKLAKRSQKLLCSPAVDLRHYVGQHEAPLDAPAAGSPAHAQRRHPDRALVHRAGQAKPAPVLERRHRRHAQRRTATSMPKTALPPFLVETVGIAAADPGLFHAFGRLDRGGVLLGDADATNVQMAGHHFSQVYLVTSSRRCVQHAQCRRIVGEEMAPIRPRLLSGCDTTKTQFMNKLIGGLALLLLVVGAGAAPTPTGPGAARPTIAASTASSSAMRLSAGRAGGPRTSVTAGRQDGA